MQVRLALSAAVRGCLTGVSSSAHDAAANLSRTAMEYGMLDVVYILVTLVFFGLMLAYVRGCELLGRESTGEDERP